MRITAKAILAALAGFMSVAPLTVQAATCVDVTLADRASSGEQTLVLNGLGIRKATFLKVKVYVAGLYLPEPSNDPKKILSSTGAWRLELHFLRDVGVSDIRSAWQEGFEQNAGASLKQLEQRIGQLNALMSDFSKAQVLAFAYDPGSGLQVAVDDSERGSIAGADFATAMLAIWLGPEPPNADLKQGLLGHGCK